MQVRVKLFAGFREGRFAARDQDLEPGITVGEVIRSLDIEPDEVGVVMVNSRHAGPGQELAPGDTLAIFPVIGGG